LNPFSDDKEDNRKMNKAIKYTLKNLRNKFLSWWKQEQKRLAALNKDNPGIEMDI